MSQDSTNSTEKSSVFSSALIWFGAGVSIAEILTGTFFAPLGFAKGTAAILIGHLIGCVLLFAAGVIGGKSGKGAMESTAMNFGKIGSKFFAVANLLQLVGWTAVMISSGAAGCESVFSFNMPWVWCLVIAVLIAVWIIVDLKQLNVLNTIAMVLLFVLTIVMSVVIFSADKTAVPEGAEALSFGAAIELSIAMPLSWLPLISDYTRNAKKPVASSAAGSAVYFAVSSWMYFIGMGAAIITGEGDVALIMLKAGLGIAALVIIIFSTVTTTYLDAFSAGVSAGTVNHKLSEKVAALVAVGIGAVLAIFAKPENMEEFLYWIGSIFAPMISIQIADYFINKNDSSGKLISIPNAVIWIAGFVLYRFMMRIDLIIGCTIPVMLIVAVVTVIVNQIIKAVKK